MASSAALTRGRQRVERICLAVRDARSLRLQLLEEIGRVVPFSAYAWLLTDPETSVGSSPLADVPCLPELPNLIRLKYLCDLNRWTTLLESPVALLQQATKGVLARSPLWEQLLQRYDVGDMASVVFRDRFGCWGFLDLWRRNTDPTFTEDGAGFLREIAAPVTEALRQSQAGTFAVRAAAPSRPLGPVVLLLSHDLQVLAQTPETQEYLQLLVPAAPDRQPIPANAYNVAAQLLAVEGGVDRNPPSARVHLVDGLWVTLRAARLGDGEPGDTRDIAVTIEETSPADRLAVFARAFGFSPRESELLGRLAGGSDTRGLAQEMFLSELTVQDHLKSMFAKTETHSRQSLMSRARGA